MAEKNSGERGFYGWANLAVLAGVGIIGGFYIASLSYFFPTLLDEFGWNRTTPAFASTINMIVLGLSGPAAGAFIMKFGARRSLVLGNLLGFAGFFLLCFHSELWHLYLGFGVLIGTAAGFGGLLASTTVINNWFVKKRSLGLGLSLAAGGVGGIFIGPAIIAMIHAHGWRPTFMIISAIVLLFGVIIPGIFVRNKPEDLGQLPDGSYSEAPTAGPPPAPTKASYKTPVDFTAAEAIRTPCLWLLIGYYCINMLIVNALMFHQVAYLVDLGIKDTIAATALSVMTGVMTFSQLGTGFLGMKFSMHHIAVSAEVLKIIGIAILVSTQSLPLVFLYMIVLGLSFGGFMVAMLNILPNYFGIKHYPQIMGFVRLFWAFAGGLGAPIAGYIYDKTGSYLPAYKGAIAIAIIGLVCLILARPPVHPSLETPQQADSVAA